MSNQGPSPGGPAMRDRCGVVGVALAETAAAHPLYSALYALQHRGQEAAGIVTHDGFQQHSHVETGLVSEVFGADALSGLLGRTGIGHVRYPTQGGLGACCAQPFAVSFKSGSLGLAHNGNLINTTALRDGLAAAGHAFTSEGDTEVIAHELARQLLTADRIEAIERTMTKLHGSYALTIMHDETVMGLRDPQGNRPLCVGELDDGYVLASESAAIDALGGTLLRDVRPGELVILDPDGGGFDSHQLVDVERTAHCFFEHVYFARPDSIIDGSLVYATRRALGAALWRESGVASDVVMPVPDSGRSFAAGYAAAAQEAGADLAFAEGLMKNRYVGRTFIMPSQDARERAVRIKLNPIRSTVVDRRVTIIDDSIVRGTTSRELVSLLREAGATEVHLRIGAPPIIAPCYMGIDMPTRAELIAADRSPAAVAAEIGADSLAFLSIDAITEVLETDRGDLCLGCVTGAYPYAIADEQTDRPIRPALAGSSSD